MDIQTRNLLYAVDMTIQFIHNDLRNLIVTLFLICILIVIICAINIIIVSIKFKTLKNEFELIILKILRGDNK